MVLVSLPWRALALLPNLSMLAAVRKGIKAVLQQIFQFLTGCQLLQYDQYNGHKMVVVFHPDAVIPTRLHRGMNP